MSRNLLNGGGHGGKDNGCTAYDGTFEKYYALELSTKIYNNVEPYLKSKSYILRTKDTYMTLESRCNYADKLAPVYWFEWHFNAYNGKAKGIEIYTSNFTSDKNKNFATYLCKEYSKLMGITNRGAKTKLNGQGKDYYYLHRNTGSNTTVFIVETLFIDNKEDFHVLKSKDFMNKTAEFFAKNILNQLYDISIKENTEEYIYRVYSGAYSKEENAKERVIKLKEKGFDSYYKKEKK